jgi:hypothetical protein
MDVKLEYNNNNNKRREVFSSICGKEIIIKIEGSLKRIL